MRFIVGWGFELAQAVAHKVDCVEGKEESDFESVFRKRGDVQDEKHAPCGDRRDVAAS